jgi:saccharopine dehydrogenase-like NADP-dependent oxidoreductase
VRVLIVGGAGDMGQVACATVAADGNVTGVVVADRDGDRAEAIARGIGPKASSLALDITDPAALSAALADADIVLNTVGPFYRFGRPVLEAAIAARVHYADINDDWEPTIDMLTLHDAAVQAGVVAIIGMGASPGVSNLLASAAAASLDEVDALHTGWPAGTGMPKIDPDGPPPRASAALVHWIHNLSAPIRVWRDGRYQEVEALEERTITYPGIGEGTVWTCGHPEPITLPRTFPGIRESLNLMTSRPGLIAAARAACYDVRSGTSSVEEAGVSLLLAPGRRGPAAGERAPFPDVWALAEGSKDGRRTVVGVTTDVLPDGQMGEMTSIPLSIAASMIAAREIIEPGVHAPEAVIDPETFFDRLSAYAGDRADGERLRITTLALD